MMRMLVTFAVASGLAVIVEAQSDFELHEERSLERVLRFAGSGIQTLDLRLISGSIRVSGAAGDDVRLEATQRIDAKTRDDVRAAEREVSLETMDNAAAIQVFVRDPDRSSCGEPWEGSRSRAWWDRRRYEVTYDVRIRVPRATRLRLCTINRGDVFVEGTTADFDVSNVNGRITLENMGGSGRATTVNGPVTVAFAAAPKSDSLFKTVNGDVAVTFPSTLAANLRMKTMNGGLFTDFDVDVVPPKPDTAQRRNGRFVYRSNRFTAARVGGGGPELTFETLNGDVRLLRSAK